MPYLDGLPPAAALNLNDIIIVDQGGTPGIPGTATTGQSTIALLGAFIGAGTKAVNLTSSGTTQTSAFVLPASICVFSTVPSGTGAVIPATTVPGDIWDVWNASSNDMLVWPFVGGTINFAGENNPVTISTGGRATFVVNTPTQIIVG